MQAPLKNMWLPYTPFSRSTFTLLLTVQAAVALLVWMLADSTMLPTPFDVASSWWNLVQTQNLLLELWQSATVLLLALLLATGFSLALTAAATAPIFAGLAKFSSLLRFLGFAGLTYLFMLLTQNAYQLKVALLSFGMTVMMVTAMQAEVQAISHYEVDHCKTLGLKNWRITYELVLLGKADVFFDLVRQNAAIGWTLLTMVEGLSRSEGGIGAMLLNQNRYFQLSGVFAIQLTILLYGLAQDWLFAKLKHFACPYSLLEQSGELV